MTSVGHFPKHARLRPVLCPQQRLEPRLLRVGVAVGVGAREILVLRVPHAHGRAFAALCALSSAERDVAELAVAGLSNLEIASRRGTSERAVANQLASVFRKLDVDSRRELAVRLQRETGQSP